MQIKFTNANKRTSIKKGSWITFYDDEGRLLNRIYFDITHPIPYINNNPDSKEAKLFNDTKKRLEKKGY